MALRLHNRAAMRRVLLVAAVVLPLAVLAAVAGSGQLLETNNYNATSGTSYVNAAQCVGNASTSPLDLEWNIVTASGVTFTGGGLYRVFASTAQPTQATGTNGIYCAESSSPTATPPVTAGQVGYVAASTVVQDLAISGSGVVAAVGKTCDPSQEGQQIWICAHWYDSTSTKNGYASGKFVLQLAAPASPTGVTVSAGDSKLYVSWAASSGGTVTADHYIAYATPAGGTPIPSDRTTSTNATITGLTNGTPYDVTVIAYSVGGNPSAASSPAVSGTPQPSADFWDVYKASGGVERGGCASGPGGALSIVAAAALLALRRRKP